MFWHMRHDMYHTDNIISSIVLNIYSINYRLGYGLYILTQDIQSKELTSEVPRNISWCQYKSAIVTVYCFKVLQYDTSTYTGTLYDVIYMLQVQQYI